MADRQPKPLINELENTSRDVLENEKYKNLDENSVKKSISEVELQIEKLDSMLDQAKQAVQNWVDANTSLAQSAQQSRAETQSMGRGLGGALLGSKYRSSRRKEASFANAQIARNVASRRAVIRSGKQESQERVREIQSQIKKLKTDLKFLKDRAKEIVISSKKSKPVKSSSIKSSVDSMAVLEKLSELHQKGILTDEEYKIKRQKIVDQI
jgi:hypothetical protein